MQKLAGFALVAAMVAWTWPSWAATCDGTIHDGQATYYDFADGTGVCGFPAETGNQMVVALDAPELNGTAMCGACIHISGPSGEVTVIVVNGCPGCGVGHLDLSPQAYDVIASGYNGVPPITWQYVPCQVTGPIRYAYYAGSSTNFAWVQVRNHRHPIVSIEARMPDGNFALLERSDWGYFKAEGLPAGGQNYRVTDTYGQVLEDTNIAVLDQGEVEGQAQFPECTGMTDGGGTAGSGGSAGAAGAGTGGTSAAGSGTGGSGVGGSGTAGTGTSGSGTGPTADAGLAAASDDDSGCGCEAGPGLPTRGAWAWAGLIAAGLLVWRPRRRC